MSADGSIVPQTAPAPLPTAPVPDGARLAQDAAREKALAKVRPAPATAPAAAPATTAKIEMDPATLKTMTKQAAALRAAEQRVAELEAGSKDIAQVSEAKKLYASGKRLEAIALLSGKDATEEMTALMDAYLETAPTAPEDPQAKRLEALEAAEKARGEAEKTAKEQADAETVRQRDASIQGFAWSVLDAEKDQNGAVKYPLCASKKNRGEAAIAARKLVTEVYAPKDHPDGGVTPDQARALFTRAFAEVEVEYRKDFLESYGYEYVPPGSRPLPGNTGRAAPAPRQATTVTPPEPTRANQSPTLARPAISTAEYPRSLTHREALAKAIEKIKSYQR